MLLMLSVVAGKYDLYYECFAERMKGILLQTCGHENDSHNLLNKKIRKFWEQKFG